MVTPIAICPPEIVALVRGKIEVGVEGTTTNRGKRWSPVQEILELPTNHADVRQFATFDTVTRFLSGALLGRWILDRTSQHSAPEPTPWKADPIGVHSEVVLRTLIVNFAYSDDRKSCFIETIAMSGRTERAQFKVERHQEGEFVGMPISEIEVSFQSRGRRDLCMPAKWVSKVK